MLYKLTSVKTVIAKVFTDLELKEGDHRVSDMIEWAGEAVEKIGAFTSFKTKVAGKDDNPILVVTNYQTALPYDFHSLVQAAYSENSAGPFYPMRRATGSMDYGSSLNSLTAVSVENVSSQEIIILVQSLYDYTYEQALAFVNNYPEKTSQLSYLLDQKRKGTDFTGGTDNTKDFIYTITNIIDCCKYIAIDTRIKIIHMILIDN